MIAFLLDGCRGRNAHSNLMSPTLPPYFGWESLTLTMFLWTSQLMDMTRYLGLNCSPTSLSTIQSTHYSILYFEGRPTANDVAKSPFDYEYIGLTLLQSMRRYPLWPLHSFMSIRKRKNHGGRFVRFGVCRLVSSPCINLTLPFFRFKDWFDM